MILHSFFPNPSLYLATKMNLLKKPLSSFIPLTNSYFSVYNFNLVRQLLLNLIDASEFLLPLSTGDKIILQKKNIIPITPFVSILLNF